MRNIYAHYFSVPFQLQLCFSQFMMNCCSHGDNEPCLSVVAMASNAVDTM